MNISDLEVVLLSGIESRAAFAFYEYLENLRSGEGGPELLRMILQFDGPDVLIRPFPNNSRPIDERWIEEKSGFRVNLAEKGRDFFSEYVTVEATDVETAAPLHTTQYSGNQEIVSRWQCIDYQENLNWLGFRKMYPGEQVGDRQPRCHTRNA